MPDNMLPLAEIAAKLQCSLSTLHKTPQADLPRVKILGRVYASEADVLAYDARRRTPKPVQQAARPTRDGGDRANNRFLDHAGERLTIAQWSRRTGIPYSVLYQRVAKGMPVVDALTIPPGGRPR